MMKISRHALGALFFLLATSKLNCNFPSMLKLTKISERKSIIPNDDYSHAKASVMSLKTFLFTNCPHNFFFLQLFLCIMYILI